MDLKKIIMVASLILLIGTSFVYYRTNEPQPRILINADDWNEDLDYLIESIKNNHPNPFFYLLEENFNETVASIRSKMSDMTKDEVISEFMSLIAQLKDGHTLLFPLQSGTNFKIYPLRLYLFSDGVYITDAMAGFTKYIGGKITKINGIPVSEVINRLSGAISHDNQATIDMIIPIRLIIPNLLYASSVITNYNRPKYTIEFEGKTRTINFDPIAYETYRDWIFPNRDDLSGIRESFDEVTFLSGLPQANTPFYLDQKDVENFRYQYIEETKVLYIQYNFILGYTPSGPSLSNLISEIKNIIKTKDVVKIIVDVRHNPGGDNNTDYPMVKFLQELSNNTEITTFVITSRETFSAAANFVTVVEKDTDAIFVGESIGGSPNLYGDTGAYILPNSRLFVEISSRYWQMSTADDTRLTISPKLEVPLSSTDYFNGIDPSYSAILDYSV